MGITSIAINESRNIIITGSTDCSVRIWTMCGRYIGTLGQKHNWAMDESVLDLSKLPQIIPEDVRRVASANTLRTVKGGVHTQWKMVKNALAFLRLDIGKGGEEGINVEKNVEEGVKMIKTPFGVIKKKIEKKEDKNNSSKSEDNKPVINLETQQNNNKNEENNKNLNKNNNNKDDIKIGQINPIKNDTSRDLSIKRSGMRMQRRPSMTTIWMEDAPMKTIMEFQQTDKVEQTYQKLVKHGVTSSVLGKHGWKKKFRRERAPLSANYERLNAPGEGLRPPLAPVAQLTLQDMKKDIFTVTKHTPVRWEAKHAIVYSRLPFATLDTPTPPVISNVIRKELGQSDSVKRWTDGSLEQQIRASSTNKNEIGSDGIGAEKLLRLANRAKHVQRASKILKQRINNSKMNLKDHSMNKLKNNNDLGSISEKNEAGGNGEGGSNETAVKFKNIFKKGNKNGGDNAMFPKI